MAKLVEAQRLVTEITGPIPGKVLCSFQMISPFSPWYTHSLAEANKPGFVWEQIWQTRANICPEYQSKDNNSTNYPLSES